MKRLYFAERLGADHFSHSVRVSLCSRTHPPGLAESGKRT